MTGRWFISTNMSAEARTQASFECVGPSDPNGSGANSRNGSDEVEVTQREARDKSSREDLRKKDGYIYTMVTINSVKGLRFGLGIKHFNDQVIVSKSEKGSVCGSQLKVLDHIVEVNGIPVTDKDVCREILIKSMQNTNTVDLVIERPVKEETIANMKHVLDAASRPTPASSPKTSSPVRKDSRVRSAVNIHSPTDSTKGMRNNSQNADKQSSNNNIQKGNMLEKSNLHQRLEKLLKRNSSEEHIQERKQGTRDKRMGNTASGQSSKHSSAIVVKGKKDNGLVAKLGLKRKSEIPG
ncbi:hypothetical protein Q1695_014572 [Nippostrongylus brasiliensis]|nr:hypothetical protein Q1695_014572 [Nippostrongylus brasiliensis]